ncbi:retrovirus-related pol polyprotein from transposon TNT 1-94, partial [Tanacetum coccineum]
VLNEVADEFVQEDIANFDGHMFHNAPQTPKFDVAESSSTYQDPSSMHQIQKQHRSIDRWTKNHPLERVIGYPSKPVMIRKRIQTNTEVYELNQLKRLDVWELVEYPIGRNIIKVEWIWKNKTNAENTVIRNRSRLMDVKTTFLNSPLKEEVFVQHLNGFVDLEFPNHFYRLKKALYGLKQVPRAWFINLPRARPTKKHLKEVKRIFPYLRQSINMGLWYSKDSGFELTAYADADHVGCNDDCKSTSGGIHFLGDKLVSWSSKSKIVQLCHLQKQSMHPCILVVLKSFGCEHSCWTMDFIPTRFRSTHVEKCTIELYFVGTEYQLADLFTKALPKERFEFLVHKIGMRCMTLTQLERLAKLSS